MALSVTYNVVNGVILSETRGGVDTIFVPDTNGSLVECRDASGNKTYSAEYWPYGEVQTETGSKANPWGFGGLVGYLRDLGNLLYVRARHLRVDLGRWQTTDPLWPREQAYEYVGSVPNARSDPSGLFNPFCIGCGICLGIGLLAALIGCSSAGDGFFSCVLCFLAANPWAQTLLLACAVLCVACLPALSRLILPPPVPVPVPAGAFVPYGALLPMGQEGGGEGTPCTGTTWTNCVIQCLVIKKSPGPCRVFSSSCGGTPRIECTCKDFCWRDYLRP